MLKTVTGMKGQAMADKRATVLVVDDEENNRKVVAAQLKNQGYVILTADSGEAALEIVDQQMPDLVLLDAMMPGISGFDVAEILKSEQRTANIPIIMITALGSSESRISALANGVEEFLTKPVAREELVMRIRNLLKLKKFQDDLSTYSNELEVQVAERAKALNDANMQLDEAQKRLLQSDKMAALGQLAAGVAHEINNPVGYVNSNLGTLKGYAKDFLKILRAYQAVEQTRMTDTESMDRLKQMKADFDLDFLCEDMPQLIDESIDGLSRVRRIVQDLKGFAHADVQHQWELADLHKCLDTTLNIANNEIKYKATVMREYGELPEIECCPSQLNQVFLNILVNAAQAIPVDGNGLITVRTNCASDAVSIEISDNGQGISPENIKRIFEPFFTTKPVGMGTGMGLSLSYGIIHKHNGYIDVSSEVGKGTTFRIVLPIHRSATLVTSRNEVPVDC